MTDYSTYEIVVGLEVHAQLLTKSKLFCGDSIAFGAERRNEWQLGVKIIPVGITYDAPRLFRSRTTVEYGPPIDPSPWAEADQQDHEKAVNDFTAGVFDHEIHE